MVAPGLRLDILKALGDNTRYAIYLEIARSPSPLATAEIAESLGLHPNTVRPHLERMKEVGLLESRPEVAGTVGRPQKLYSLAEDAPSLGLEPPVFPMLARMLIDMARASSVETEVVLEAGRSEGRRRAQSSGEPVFFDDLVFDDLALDDSVSDDLVSDAHFFGERIPGGSNLDGAGADRTNSGGHGDLVSLTHMQEQLGFDPAVLVEEAGPQRRPRAMVAFTHCPFFELAAENPGIVCALHRGLVEGFIGESESVTLESFNDVVDREPCRMELSLVGTATL